MSFDRLLQRVQEQLVLRPTTRRAAARAGVMVCRLRVGGEAAEKGMMVAGAEG